MRKAAVWLWCGWVVWYIAPGILMRRKTHIPPAFADTKERCEVELKKVELTLSSRGIDISAIVFVCLPVGLTPQT